MTDREVWCNNPTEHPQHWLEKALRCGGVTRDEEAIMGVLVENGYGISGNVDRDDARRLIAALDEARGDA